VHLKIVAEINRAKYFDLGIDSALERVHIDQLIIIIQYCSSDWQVLERFLGSIPPWWAILSFFCFLICEVVL
jgi:hypothetical protein